MARQSNNVQCRGPGCSSTAFIDAHIIPRTFAAFIRGDDPKVANVQLTLHSAKTAFPQLGDYDSGILCGVCDNVLGDLDGYAIEVVRAFPEAAVKSGRFYVMPDVDGDRLGKFFLSVIWRASISSRRNFAEIDLGPYNDVVRDMIFAEAPLSSNTALQVALERLESIHLDPSKLFSIPRPSGLGGRNGFGFMIGGFRVFVKVDKRPLPGAQINGVLGGKGVLRLFARTFEETSEFDVTADMIVADHYRKKK